MKNIIFLIISILSISISIVFLYGLTTYIYSFTQYLSIGTFTLIALINGILYMKIYLDE